ncbi:MAG: RdgB/HAM1 family non-canonical purine NTP pyrophosphatase [Acidimicrobiia bacterium]
MRLLLASANPDKAREIAGLLASAHVELLPRPATLGNVDETGDTLEGNALLKARAVMQAAAEAAVADDTGLEVDALGGRPGVHAARYAGEGATYADNVAKLLAEMEGVTDRRARFRTVAAVVWPGGREVVAHGVVEGVITDVPRGTGGFGYDAVFVPEGGRGLTYAEMSLPEKQAISHRGRAFRALAELLSLEYRIGT